MLTEATLATMTQIDKSLPLYDDRADEIAAFYGKTRAEIVATYRAYNIEKTKRPPAGLFSNGDHVTVMNSYLNEHFMVQSLTRLMLHYNRFKLTTICVNALQPLYPDGFQGLRVVDYGAGAADFALSFFVHGAQPILCDFQGGPVEFAASRFTLRGGAPEVVPVTLDNPYPDLPPCDIVNATEVLEHVIDPLKVMFNIWNALSPTGIFIFSQYPMRSKSVGGAHLQSAADLREKARLFLNLLFERIPVEVEDGNVFIYRKRVQQPRVKAPGPA